MNLQHGSFANFNGKHFFAAIERNKNYRQQFCLEKRIFHEEVFSFKEFVN